MYNPPLNSKLNVNILNKDSYPFLLKQISDLPDTIEYIGNIPDHNHKFLCIVGSRNPSEYGRRVCAELISGLKNYPVVIVSGLAIGIDSLSHELAIQHNIKTIAFPGSGLSPDILYPYSKRSLAKQIIEADGAIMSPFKNQQGATRWTFPVRNRLMAGISHATLIIEAGKGSGTLQTSDHALDFGRDVIVVPGSIFSPLSYGPHMLIKRGAIPVTCADDILETLGFEVKTSDRPDQLSFQTQIESIEKMNIDIISKNILKLLIVDSLNMSQIQEKLNVSIESLHIKMSELEISGLIHERDGVYTNKI
jgi:DNA processing protein